MRKPKAAFVSFGEVNTPKTIIAEKTQRSCELLRSNGIDVHSTAPVTDDPAGQDALRAISELAGTQVDFVIACLAGWIPTHAVVRVLSEFRHLPILLWGLSGWTESGRLVTTADQAGTTALRQTLEELDFSFKYVINYFDAPPPMDRITSFARACAAVKDLHNAKIGSMGYRDMNLYATMHDGVSLRRVLGVETEFFEMLEIFQRSERIEPKNTQAVVEHILQAWTFDKPAARDILEKGARYYLAIREKAVERKYQGVSLIDVDGMKKLLQFPPAMVFMLLADDLNICTIPENDILGAATQLLTRALTGQVGAYLEFYEFFTTGVLMGVPDYVPAEIVDGPVRVTPSSFGELAAGILNVSRLKTGRVTLCRLAQRRTKYVLHLVVGQAETPRPWEEAGWAPPAPQLPGLEIKLDCDMKEFAQNVMGQHYILSYGDNSALLEDFCELRGIEIIR
jgi:L-fucose isomerase-like protein